MNQQLQEKKLTQEPVKLILIIRGKIPKRLLKSNYQKKSIQKNYISTFPDYFGSLSMCAQMDSNPSEVINLDSLEFIDEQLSYNDKYF